MDRLDWILAFGVTAAISAAFGLLIPKFGWLIGAALAVFALVRAKKKRDDLSARDGRPDDRNESE